MHAADVIITAATVDPGLCICIAATGQLARHERSAAKQRNGKYNKIIG